MLADVLNELLIKSLSSFLRSLKFDASELLSQEVYDQQVFPIHFPEILKTLDASVVSEIFISLRPHFLNILKKSQEYQEFSAFLSQIPDFKYSLLKEMSSKIKSLKDLIKILDERPEQIQLHIYLLFLDLVTSVDDLILLFQTIPENYLHLFLSAMHKQASDIINTEEDLEILKQHLNSTQQEKIAFFISEKETSLSNERLTSFQLDSFAIHERAGINLIINFEKELNDILNQEKIEYLQFAQDTKIKEIVEKEKIQYESIIHTNLTAEKRTPPSENYTTNSNSNGVL